MSVIENKELEGLNRSGCDVLVFENMLHTLCDGLVCLLTLFFM